MFAARATAGFVARIARRGGGAAVSSQTAAFRASTLAGAGGWRPLTASGARVDLATVDDQTGATRTWSISGGRLIANGTPGVDDGKTLTLTTTAGDSFTATIDASVAGCTVLNNTECKAASEALGGVGTEVEYRKDNTTSIADEAQRIARNITYDPALVITAEDGAVIVGRMQFENSKNVVLRGLDVHETTGTLAVVNMIGSCGDVVVEDSKIHGVYRDPGPDADYSAVGSYSNCPKAFVWTAGSGGDPGKLTMQRNQIYDTRAGISWKCHDELILRDNEIFRTYSDPVTITWGSGCEPASVKKWFIHNVYHTMIGRPSDLDNPHIDLLQFQTALTAGAAVEAGRIEQCVGWENPAVARGRDIQGFFTNAGTADWVAKDWTICANATMLTGGHPCTLGKMDGGDVYSNQFKSLNGDGTAQMRLGNVALVNPPQFKGNIVEVATEGATDTDSLVIGDGGAIHAYADVFVAPNFNITTLEEFLSAFAMKPFGPADADNSGTGTVGDYGAIGSGAATFGTALDGAGWSVNENYAPGLSPIVIAGLGQSEFAYVSERGGIYQTLTPPALEAENLTIYQRNGAGLTAETTTTKTVLTSANRLTVNPAMVVMANALNHVAPGRQFAFVDLCEPGTGRTGWVDDANNDRIWARSADMVAEAVADYGGIDRMCEFWWANDQTAMPNWLANMAAIYYGQNPDGSAFTLGNTRSTATISPSAVVDHCIYDFESADTDTLGRGLLKRSVPLDIVRKGPWDGDSESRYIGVESFVADSRFVALGGKYGPPAFTWWSNGAHPIVTDPVGQYEAMFDMAFPSFLRAAGLSADEAAFDSITVAPGGAYADISFTPANGGVLSTKRKVKGIADPASPSDYWQEVAGFEILRVADPDGRFYIMRPGSTGIATKYQGTVTLQNDTTVRITPEVAFSPGDQITFLWGPAFSRSDAGYVYPSHLSDAEKLMLDIPIEHVAAYTNSSATDRFCGFCIKTYSDIFEAPGIPEPVPATFWTQGVSAPHWRDPSALPAGTFRVRFEVVARVPASTLPLGSSTTYLGGSEGTWFNLHMNRGTRQVLVWGPDTKDSALTGLFAGAYNVEIFPTDSWRKYVVDVNLVTQEMIVSINDVALPVQALNANTGIFPSAGNRRLTIASKSGAGNFWNAGLQIGYAQYEIDNGSGLTLLKRLDGGAAAVNADPWLMAGAAV